MEQEKPVQDDPADLQTPNLPGHDGTNGEEGGGRVNVPTEAPSDGN